MELHGEVLPCMCEVLHSSPITSKEEKKKLSATINYLTTATFYFSFVLVKEDYTEIAWSWNQAGLSPWLGNQRQQDSIMSTPVASDTTPRLQKPTKGQKKKVPVKATIGVCHPWRFRPWSPEECRVGQYSPSLFPNHSESSSARAWQGLSC
jgi:hypothetical protein